MIYTTGISIYVLYRGRYKQKLRGLGLLFICSDTEYVCKYICKASLFSMDV